MATSSAPGTLYSALAGIIIAAITRRSPRCRVESVSSADMTGLTRTNWQAGASSGRQHKARWPEWWTSGSPRPRSRRRCRRREPVAVELAEDAMVIRAPGQDALAFAHDGFRDRADAAAELDGIAAHEVT